MSTYLIFKNNKYVCEDRKVYVPCDMKTIIFIIYKNQLTLNVLLIYLQFVWIYVDNMGRVNFYTYILHKWNIEKLNKSIGLINIIMF